MSDVEYGRGYVLITDVEINDELKAKLSERATHIYRDAKGNITNTIVCCGIALKG